MKRNIPKELLCIACIGGGIGTLIGKGWTTHGIDQYAPWMALGLVLVVVGFFLLPEGAE